VLIVSSACQRRLTVEEYRVTAAVKQYNLLLPQVYSTSRVDLLEPVTGEDERQRVGGLLTDLRRRGWTLDCRQNSFETAHIEIASGAKMADLESDETWWYRQVDTATGGEAQAPKRLRYALRYKLLQRQGHWLVDRIEILKSEELPAK